MSDTNHSNYLVELSQAMTSAVQRAGVSTVMVEARRRLPASGIAYSSNMILTAAHVIERREDIQVMLPDGSLYPASFSGYDPGSDLALLRLDQELLEPARMVEVDPEIGQLVLALGRPNQDGIQASLGIVSAIGGPVPTRHGMILARYLRTDTIPYPGFSGGPLIDASGQVVGINTSGLTPGAAITIPASIALEVAGKLARHGRIPRGYLGVRTQPVELAVFQQQVLARQQANGLLVVGIEGKSPSEAAGVLVGDILVGFGGEPVTEHERLLSLILSQDIGEVVPLEVLRGGQVTHLRVIIGERTQ
jgi:S1-C subfamily serine protease